VKGLAGDTGDMGLAGAPGDYNHCVSSMFM